MPPAKTITITLGGEQRTLCYRFAAFRALGLTGPLDGEGWDRALQEAGASFEACAKFVHAGLLHEKCDDSIASILEGMADWDIEQFVALVKESSLAVFGPLMPNGDSEKSTTRPPEAQTGLQPGPLPPTTLGLPGSSGT